MPFAENLAPFFAVSDFGTAATYTVGLTTSTVNGIFDKAYADPSGLVEGTAPVFLCRAVDVPTVAHGQTLTIGGTVYTIRGVEPDGTGVVLLRLEA